MAATIKKDSKIINGIIHIIPILKAYFFFASLSYIGCSILFLPIRIIRADTIIEINLKTRMKNKGK